MPKIRSITRLKRKRAEIAASIKLHEKQLAQARFDLAHVEATMRIFAVSGKPQDISRLCRLLPAIQVGRALGDLPAALRISPEPFNKLPFASNHARPVRRHGDTDVRALPAECCW